MIIEDIYEIATYNRELMRWVIGVTCIMCFLVLVQILMSLIESRRIGVILSRVEKMLDLIEMHGSVTDRQQEKMVEVLTEVRRERQVSASDMKHTVEAVPDKVVEKMHEAITGSGDGIIPVIKTPTVRKPPTSSS